MHVGLSNTKYALNITRRPLPPGSVSLNPGFWRDRKISNRHSGLRHGYEQLKKAGNFDDLRLAAGHGKGDFIGKRFMDSDVYKWLEAVAYELFEEPDEKLSDMAEEAIELIIAAQQDDGYINSYFQVAEPGKRWTDLSRGHELYCAGHLMEAAVVFNRFLGDGRLLEAACRFADYIGSVFGPEKRLATPGHPEIELALVELYRETGEKSYLDLARFFLDQRGRGHIDPGAHRGHGGPPVYQDHVPVREASTCEGHAVRQLYLTSGLTDVYLETGEGELFDALMRQWDDMTQRKMFVTGGVGQTHNNEAFNEPYELSNSRAYCETCAAIASIMWNWRLLLSTGEGRFSDLIEHTLFNAFLSGVSLDGDRFFYVNSLLSRGADPAMGRKRIERIEWPWTPCCPPNVMRMLALLDHYVATSGDDGLQIHQYIPSTIRAELGKGSKTAVDIETDYPWDERISVRIVKTESEPWSLQIRIPGWCEDPALLLNGESITDLNIDKGYAQLRRVWREGDEVVLILNLKAVLLEAHPHVDSARECLAIKRGPIVYCLEQQDQEPDVDILDVRIDETGPLETKREKGMLGGIVTVEARGYVADNRKWKNRLYKTVGDSTSCHPVSLRAIPYYAWANRGPNAMRVWIPRYRPG